VSGALLYFQIAIHSDSVFLDDLSRDLFGFGGNWNDWRLTPAPAYFPDMLLYFVGYFLFSTVVDRIFFVTFVQVILLGLAVMFVVRQLASRSRMLAQTVGIGVVAFVTLLCAHSSAIWLYFYTTNNHFTALLLPLVSVGLMVSFLRRSRPAPLVWLVVLGMLGQISTAVYVIVYAAPVIVAVLVLWGVSWRLGVGSHSFRRGLLSIGGAAGVGAILAILVSMIVTPYDGVDGRFGFPGSEALVLRGVRAMIATLLYAFGGGGPVVLTGSLTLLAGVAYLLILAWRRFAFSFGATAERIETRTSAPRYSIATEGGSSAFALWIAAWSLPIAVVGSVISGGLADMYGYRYWAFPLWLMAIVAAIHAVRTFVAPRRGGYVAVTGLSMVLLLLAGLSLPVRAANPRVDPNTLAASACLDQLREEGVELGAGLADYWYGRGVTVLMEDRPEITTVHGNLDPFYYMSTIGPLTHPDRYPRTYNFALVHPGAGGAPWNVNEENLSQSLPAPDNVFACTTGIEVWTWDDLEMDAAVKSHFNRWLDINAP
jgi:hypothetical protein